MTPNDKHDRYVVAEPEGSMEPTPEVLRDLHRRMVRIRKFEEAAGRLQEANKLPGFLHLYVGQEAVARTIRNAVLSDRVAHAYLFCGPSARLPAWGTP